MATIEQEIQKIKEEKFFKELQRVYDKLEQVVKDECDTSIEQFFYDYITTKKNLNK